MSYMKGYGTSAKGNDRLLKQYGGSAGSSPMARQHYATGGAVKGGNPSLDEGLSAAADGAPAKRSLARPGRKVAGKKKDAKTNINIIVAGAPGKPDAPGAPAPVPGPMAGPPPPMPPPGGPPMPMRANGGPVGRYAKGGRIANLGKYAHGGKIKKADGGPTPGEQMKAARDRRDEAASDRNYQLGTGAVNAGVAASLAGVPGKFGKFLKYGNAALAGMGALKGAAAQGRKSAAEAEMKRLGEGKAVEGEEDRKHGGKVKRAEGGSVHGLRNEDGGAMSGSGRLAKVRMYGK